MYESVRGRGMAKEFKDFDDKKPVRSRSHMVMMENRQKVSITGVEDVESFDENSVLLITDVGLISLHGMDLRINKLNLEDGQLIVEGSILALEYSDQPGNRGKGEGFWGRLFK
jgi:sporulation protein YabP